MIIGLTGKIGVGKSFVAKCFKELGAAVFDADFIVHQLYQANKNIIDYANNNFFGVVVNGKINRTTLSKYFLIYDTKWKQFQSLVHFTVLQRLKSFLIKEKKVNRNFLVLDVPLLLETGVDSYCNFVIFIHANDFIHSQRLSKRNISKKKLCHIHNLQLPIKIKRELSDFTINAGVSKMHVFSQVQEIVTIFSK